MKASLLFLSDGDRWGPKPGLYQWSHSIRSELPPLSNELHVPVRETGCAGQYVWVCVCTGVYAYEWEYYVLSMPFSDMAITNCTHSHTESSVILACSVVVSLSLCKPSYINLQVIDSAMSLLPLPVFYLVQLKALQALQRQPNAAQYFQQLMLQQQINSAQLQNLAAVQQVQKHRYEPPLLIMHARNRTAWVLFFVVVLVRLQMFRL